MNPLEKYPVLFHPAKIGSMTVKNRVVMAPMGTHSADPDGNMNQASMEFYARRAQGGVGLIMVGMMTVDEEHGLAVTNQYIPKREHLTSYCRLTEEVHSYGTKIIGQLYHGGAMCDPAVSGNINFSASDQCIYPDRPTRAMTVEEIKRLREKFVEKALLLKEAEFDGVEIHAAHGYLLSQFLSPFHNHRTDEYGGSFENRFRILREIIEDVRTAVGPQFVITVRFPGDEFSKDLSPLHMGLSDGIQIAKAIEATGMVDALNVTYGNAYNANANSEPYSYPSGWKKSAAKAIKDSVSLPVLSTNTIKTPEFAEQMLEEGVSDFVVIGRALLADPDFVKKAWEGKEDDIRRCMGCLHCRSGLRSVGLQCAVNPLVLREVSHGPEKMSRNGAGKAVAVVGGGPAGMQSAITLAQRGYAVTLYEKMKELGGSVNAADKAPHKEKMTHMIRFMERQTVEAGVRIVKDCEATPELISQIDPAGVFLAMGAKPIVPNLPGVHQDNVYIAEQVQREQISLPGKTVVIGGGMTGMEVAESLEAQGGQVTLVEMSPAIGVGLSGQLVQDVLTRMRQTTVLTRHMLVGINGNTVTCKNLETNEVVNLSADHIVLALGAKADLREVESYYDVFGAQRVFIVGDMEKTGKVYDAVKDGFLKAFNFDSP